jgi:catechol 2,3-dioxygenase-like lactoylglutathione lyase family enzyme
MTASDAHVRAIGGVFFRSSDPGRTREWYRRHLGLRTDAYGTNFAWRHAGNPERSGYTQWSPFAGDTAYFGDQDQQFMINYRVDDLEGLLAQLRADGVEVVGDVQQEPYGKFAHIVDVDGRRVELWEPVDDEYERMLDGVTN